MNSEQINKTKELLRSSEQISIIAHRSPDGDAIGSALALHLYFRKKGYNSKVIMPNDFPLFLKWLPCANQILIYEDDASACNWVSSSDLIFTLDFNNLTRAEPITPVLCDSSASFVMIDHHQMPCDYACVTYSLPDFSSTSQMIYDFICCLGDEPLIDKDIATCLYTGIMTDTGCFKFSTTTSQTHLVISKLLSLGIDGSLINSLVYDSYSLNRLGLLGRVLNNLVYIDQFNVCYYTLTSKELAQFNFEKGDTDGFVNYGLKIKDCKMSVSFVEEEKEGIIKISFRSKADIDMNAFARKYFGGGGHINASGGKSSLTLSETIDYFKSVLPEFFLKQQ